jgi:tetratricopeptide (TPR) repeat protein
VEEEVSGTTTIVFVHGFTGDASTWTAFPALLKNDARFASYNARFWAYPTTFNPLFTLTKYVWSDDPDVDTLGRSLRTYLTTEVAAGDRLMLIGHSMGGLAIQAFLIEELMRGEKKFLERITEVMFCGTPSNGLVSAKWFAFLKGQIEDMAAGRQFIQQLRNAWKTYVDDERTNAGRLARFRVTVVAGEHDNFVPSESSGDAFPLDDKYGVPGDHIQMVKPRTQKDLIYKIVADRVLTSAPSPAEIQAIELREADLMGRVVTASEFNNVVALRELVAEASEPPTFPRVQRELGLALLGQQQYEDAVRLLRAYLASAEHKARPVIDVQAVQQLAIALSGTGEHQTAVAELNKLPKEFRNDPETLGIMGGRFKREWLKNPEQEQIGWRAYDLYRKGYNAAVSAKNHDQIVYNGINAAYMSRVLGKPDDALLQHLVVVCTNVAEPDYWSVATLAEAHLLLGDVVKAKTAYSDAKTKSHEPRHWTTTGRQALDILRRGNIQAPEIEALFANIETA